ncbi:MAG: MFS transporter [Alphaproteobacteria bacterium]|nr:MFS transporter [Alphaproteobacteria bacterium]
MAAPASTPPSPAPAPEAGQTYRLLYAALLVIGAGNSMLQPLLPPLARELGLRDASLGWIFSLSALFWVFASPFWGRRSDEVGRKPIIALGLAAYALSMAMFALVVMIGRAGWLTGAALFVALILSRAIFGAVGSATSPAAQAYVADRSTPSQRTERIAALTAAFALGATVGPAICAVLAGRFGLVFPLIFTFVLASASAWLTWRYLPEPTKPPAPRERARWIDSWRLATDDRLAPFLIYGFAISILTGTIQQTYTLYLMDRLGVSGRAAAEQASAGFMIGALALLATQMALIPRLNWRSSMLMSVGGALVAAGIVLQMISLNLGGLIVSQFIMGIGFGLGRPGFAGGGSMAVTPQEQGAAAGLVVAVNGAGFVISPITGGVAYDYLHELAPLTISLAIAIAMTVFVLRSRRLKTIEAAPAPPHTIDPTS